MPGALGRAIIRHPLIFAVCCGLGIAALGTLSGGATFGTGYAQARGLVDSTGTVPDGFFVLKFGASVLSYISGIPGGIFALRSPSAPGLGHVIASFIPAAPSGAVVLLGMVAYFAGVVQAPITATIIVMEMTQDGQVTVPLMAAALLGYLASRLVVPEADLRRVGRGLPSGGGTRPPGHARGVWVITARSGRPGKILDT